MDVHPPPTAVTCKKVSFWRCVLAVLSLLFCGCAARHNLGSPGRVIVPNECIQSLNKTPETWCEISDKGELECHGAAVTRIVGCEKFQVVNQKEKKK
jgi:hypothetical protein